MAFEISTIAFCHSTTRGEMRNLHSNHATLAANTFDAAQADLFFFTSHHENVRVKRNPKYLIFI